AHRLVSMSDDDVHLALDKLGRKCREALAPAFAPAEFDLDRAAFDPAKLAQVLQEGSSILGTGLLRIGAEITDLWHRRLLRPRRQRPSGDRAAEKREKI